VPTCAGLSRRFACDVDEGRRDRRVLALVLTDGEDDRRRLRSALDEFADGCEWTEVDEETVEPAVQTWRHLALVAARRAELLASQPASRYAVMRPRYR
jgi:hypothetical protein